MDGNTSMDSYAVVGQNFVGAVVFCKLFQGVGAIFEIFWEGLLTDNYVDIFNLVSVGVYRVAVGWTNACPAA